MELSKTFSLNTAVKFSGFGGCYLKMANAILTIVQHFDALNHL